MYQKDYIKEIEEIKEEGSKIANDFKTKRYVKIGDKIVKSREVVQTYLNKLHEKSVDRRKVNAEAERILGQIRLAHDLNKSEYITEVFDFEKDPYY